MLLNLRKLFKKYDLSFPGVVHVGGHEGEERKLYKELGIYRQIWIEPLYGAFKQLQKNVQSNPEAYCINAACTGDYVEDSVLYINLASNGQSSSALNPTGHLTKHPDITFSGSVEQVSAYPLEYLLRTDKIESKDFLLSVDVQGYELEVLKGADKILPNFKAIICEVYREELYENNPMIEEIDEYLGERGFVRVETKWTSNAWGDAMYLRKKIC